MCTVTWWSDGRGRYEVFANRDEQKSRPPADPPKLEAYQGTRYLSPRDPRAGGTWILVNEFGVVITLLNAYELEISPAPITGWESRGGLVRMLGSIRTSEELADRMGAIDHRRYPPFRLLCFFLPSRDLIVEGWVGGTDLTPFSPKQPVSSSSFETKAVLCHRADKWQQLEAQTPEALAKYHESAGEASSTHSVRMNRTDAQTWSISRIQVDTKSINFHYSAESLNLAGPSVASEISLPRRS